MKNRALYPIRIESIKGVLLFGPVLWLAMSILHSEGSGNSWWQLSGFVLIPVFSTIIRRKTNNLRGFLLGSLLLFPYVFLLSIEGLVFVYLMEAILLIIYGYFRITRGEERPLGYLYLGFSLGISAILSIAQRDMEISYLIGSLLYLIIFLFYQHRTSLYDALYDRDSRTIIGGERILQINLYIFILFLLIFLLFSGSILLLGIPVFLEKWLAAIGLDLLVILRGWFRKLFKIRVHLNMIDEDDELLREREASHMAIEELSQTRLGGIVLRLVLLIGAVIILMAIVYVIARLIQSLQMKKASSTSDYIEETAYIKPLFITRMLERKKTEKEPVSEIRKRYRRMVEPKIGLSVTRSDTAGQVAGKMPQVEKIKKKYEEDRYG